MPKKYKEEYFFYYGTLMQLNRLHDFIGKENIISIQPAMIRGKMYANSSGTFPFVVKVNQGRKAKSPTVVYGALVKIKATGAIMRKLDGYEGCSRFAFGENRPHDLYHREKAEAKVIRFNNLFDFTNYKIDVTGEKHNAWIYYGNMENDMVENNVMNTHARAGVVWKDFFKLFSV